jgi:hypothetical protein
VSHKHGLGCRTCYEAAAPPAGQADDSWDRWSACTITWENEHGPERAVELLALREPILAAHRALGRRLSVCLSEHYDAEAYGIGEFLAKHDGHALEPCGDHGRFTDAVGNVLCDAPGCRLVTDCWTCPEHGR